MTKKRVEHEKFSEEVEVHLARYLENRKERTGQEWVVTLRYTSGSKELYGYEPCWLRAIVEDVQGTEVRIYYYGYWRRA